MRKGKTPLVLIGLTIIVGGVYLLLNLNSRVKTETNVVEKTVVSEEKTVKKKAPQTDEAVYERNLNELIEGRRLNSAYQLLESYKKDYPESSSKQEDYKLRIDQLKEEIVKNYNDSLKRTYLKEDEVQGMKFRISNLQSKTTPRSLIVPYLGYSGTMPYMRFRIAFYGTEGWLFFEKAIFRVDDELFEYDFNYNDVNRQVLYASEVIEVLDISPSTKQLGMLRKIVKSNKTILRLQGASYVEDRTIGDKEKQAVNDILTIYDYENNPYIDPEQSKLGTQEIKEY